MLFPPFSIGDLCLTLSSSQWIESSRQADLFDLLFNRIDPDYMLNLNVMLNLSVAVAVTVSLNTNISKRLKWLETVLTVVDPESRQVGLTVHPQYSLLT